MLALQQGMVDRGADLTWLSQVDVPSECPLIAVLIALPDLSAKL